MSNKTLASVLEAVKRRDSHEAEFIQAVEEVFESLTPVIEKHPELLAPLERLVEPERVISFRVAWVDDKGVQQVNRGWRVQFNSTLGPYKGGLRFHPTVTQSVIKFLGFEQIFKNSLTTLPMGGGKGGSDFDPKGKSDQEVMRFCQAFMTELSRHIGASLDVPAGDIGVGGREIGFLFGQYKRIRNIFEGVLTGKNPAWGGSLLRPEATGYGVTYFAQYALKEIKNVSLEKQRCVISGSGNVALYLAERLISYGAVVITFSDSEGFIVNENGFSLEQVKQLQKLKFETRGRLSDFKSDGVQYNANQTPWKVKCDLAFPCATQNELDEADARALVESKCFGVFEGANMPSTPAAIKVFRSANVVFGPAKAANAGGVAVSGLEMAQNSQRMHWSRETVDEHLQKIMKDIFTSCYDVSKEYFGNSDLANGANIAGFLKVAYAMNDHGVF